MAAILEISLKKVPCRFLTTASFFGVNRHPNGIESKGFTYVPIFSRLRASSMRLLVWVHDKNNNSCIMFIMCVCLEFHNCNILILYS